MATTVLKWGKLSLSVSPDKILTFTDYNRKTAYKTETKENGTKKPKTVNKGPDLETIAITAHLMASLGVDVSKTITQWRDACQGGKSNALYIGGVKAGKKKWQIKDVTESNTTYQKNLKKPSSATLQINFVEWVAKGSAKSSGSSSKKKSKTPSSKVPSSTTTRSPTQQGKY